MSEHDFERVTHFPVKLWDVVDDDSSDIFRWSDDGQSFFVDDVKYENDIMKHYPGFVQISSFANLRRLLREYSFSWQNNDSGEFQFSHPAFQKGCRDAILNIMTRRKSMQAASGQHPKGRRRSGSDLKSKAPKKAWVQPPAQGNVKLRVETLMRFPDKFWAVVNDPNDLLYWGEDGSSVIVDDKKYEEEIMLRYPGFVQINSFANLRRLLREYGFTWSIRDNGFFEFTHPNMRRSRQDLLSGVKTKRKAFKAGAHHPYLQYYRMDNGFAGVQNSARYSDSMEIYDRAIGTTNTSPEVNQAIGAIQTPGQPDTPRPSLPFRRDFQHATGDHMVAHHPSIYHGLHENPGYRFLPQNPAGCAWPGLPNSGGAGDKIDPSFYYPAWRAWGDPSMFMPRRSGEEVNAVVSPESRIRQSESGVTASADGSCHSVYRANNACEGPNVRDSQSAQCNNDPQMNLQRQTESSPPESSREPQRAKPEFTPGSSSLLSSIHTDTPSAFSLPAPSANSFCNSNSFSPQIYQTFQPHVSLGSESSAFKPTIGIHQYETISPVVSQCEHALSESMSHQSIGPDADDRSLTALEPLENNNNRGTKKHSALSQLLVECQNTSEADNNEESLDVDVSIKTEPTATGSTGDMAEAV